jgi:hypothetical protein
LGKLECKNVTARLGSHAGKEGRISDRREGSGNETDAAEDARVLARNGAIRDWLARFAGVFCFENQTLALHIKALVNPHGDAAGRQAFRVKAAGCITRCTERCKGPGIGARVAVAPRGRDIKVY